MTEATLTHAIDHGLSEDEWTHILRVMNRTPNLTELGTFRHFARFLPGSPLRGFPAAPKGVSLPLATDESTRATGFSSASSKRN